MQLIRIAVAITALLAPAFGARADQAAWEAKVGDEYEITKTYESSQQSSDGSSATSRGRDDLRERVVGVRDGGLELEYDLPKDATAEDRARVWHFPVRVFKPSNGPMQLLNQHELEVRLGEWLKAAGWTREVCGRWIFTWNAFHIDCEPQSAIKGIEAFDLRSADLRAGAAYQAPNAQGSGTLTETASGPGGATFTVVMEIDPDAVRRARAETDVAVGEMMQKPVTMEAALRKRAKEDVSGTITVSFETDSAGDVRRRTKVTKIETNRPDGQSERETVEETVERRLTSGPFSGR